MANELALRDRLADPIDFIVADGTGIEKGTTLNLTDSRNAIKATSGAGTATILAGAGVAAREKIASDGRTRLSVFTKGVFDASASGAITVGDPVVFVADNHIAAAGVNTTAASGAIIVGHALETATDAEIVQFMLNL